MSDRRKDIERLISDIHDEKRLEQLYWFIVRLLARRMEGDSE
jgi:hypothetical protein